MKNIQKQQQAASQSSRDIANRLDTVKSQSDRIEQAVNEGTTTISQNLTGLQSGINKRLDALQWQKTKDVLIQSLFYPEHELR